MTKYALSPLAKADIELIWDYTVERWGEDQAETYLRAIMAAIEIVAADPRRGRPCDEIRAGYRKFAVGGHILFYRPGRNRIEIVRILHQRMDFPQHL
jgi:toxin ParE1/3/4